MEIVSTDATSPTDQENANPSSCTINRTLSMEERLALWRTQKRASKLQTNRKIHNPSQKSSSSQSSSSSKAWPPARDDIFSSSKENSSFDTNNMGVELNSKSFGRRHSLCPTTSSLAKTRGPLHKKETGSRLSNTQPAHKKKRNAAAQTNDSLVEVDSLSFIQTVCTSVQTESLDLVETSTQTAQDETLQEIVDMKAQFEVIMKENSCLKFSNEVLLQQLSEARRELSRAKDDQSYYSLKLQSKDEKLREQEQRFAVELQQFQVALQSGLQHSVVEIENLRGEVDHYKTLYDDLVKQLESEGDTESNNENEASDNSSDTVEAKDDVEDQTEIPVPIADHSEDDTPNQEEELDDAKPTIEEAADIASGDKLSI